jgi:serine phosphatase RsbU (regulator of sigma subunit)
MSKDGKPTKVLVVDDDELVLSSLRGVFTLQTDYDILDEANPLEALKLIERQPLDVVISDFLMPQMNGIDFLKEVRNLQPEAVRLLLTGYADKENAIRAINEVGLYHYIEKPWDNQAMLNIIRNALEEKSLRNQLAEKVSDLNTLLMDYGELETRHRFLEKELEMAGRVQRSLLPETFPSLAGYRFANLYQPCEAVGGDFYDFIQQGEQTTILVSDVIGHGVQAALSTMLLKGIFQETATKATEPVELLTEMNGRLNRILPDGMYAAGSVIMMEAGSPELRFANAGLPYPFVLRGNEKRLDEIVLAGPPLGLFGDIGIIQYESRSSKLEPGDVFLIGSDGIGSIEGDDSELFEDGRLRQVLVELAGLDGERVIEQLVEHATVFAKGRPQPDDVNLVAITRG